MNTDEDNLSQQKDLQEEDLQENTEEQIEEEPYAFVQEIVRQRPGKIWKTFIWSLAIITGACIFGGVSGLIFKQVNTPESPDSKVIFSEYDSEESAESEVSPASESESVISEPESVPESTVVVVPEPTEEEIAAQRITDYQALNEAMQDKAAESAPSLVTVKSITSVSDWFNTVNENAHAASGLIIAKTQQDLLILTEQSVITEGSRLVVTFGDGTTVEAVPVKSDNATNISIIKVDQSLLTEETKTAATAAVFGNSNIVEPGDVLLAVGAPTGQQLSFVFGEVTGVGDDLAVDDNIYRIISTNMDSVVGGSGFLVDTKGQVVGLIRNDFAQAGSHTMAALGITSVRNLIEDLSNNEPVNYLGINGATVTETISAETGLPVGIYVTGVTGDSPSFLSGIQPGDVLVKMNTDTVTSMTDYSRLLQGFTPGSTVTLQVMRQGDEGYVPIDFTITVGSY